MQTIQEIEAEVEKICNANIEIALQIAIKKLEILGNKNDVGAAYYKSLMDRALISYIFAKKLAHKSKLKHNYNSTANQAQQARRNFYERRKEYHEYIGEQWCRCDRASRCKYCRVLN